MIQYNSSHLKLDLPEIKAEILQACYTCRKQGIRIRPGSGPTLNTVGECALGAVRHLYDLKGDLGTISLQKFGMHDVDVMSFVSGFDGLKYINGNVNNPFFQMGKSVRKEIDKTNAG
jgi:hypothetical protein